MYLSVKVFFSFLFLLFPFLSILPSCVVSKTFFPSFLVVDTIKERKNKGKEEKENNNHKKKEKEKKKRNRNVSFRYCRRQRIRSRYLVIDRSNPSYLIVIDI